MDQTLMGLYRLRGMAVRVEGGVAQMDLTQDRAVLEIPPLLAQAKVIMEVQVHRLLVLVLVAVVAVLGLSVEILAAPH